MNSHQSSDRKLQLE